MEQRVTKKSPRPHGQRVCAGARKKQISLNILIACEESQAECEAFRALGHNAYSCDLQPCRPKGHPEWHIHEDVTPYLYGKTSFRTQDGKLHRVPRWNLIVAHPPCTYICKLSSCQLYKPITGRAWLNGKLVECNVERAEEMRKGREFFLTCLKAKADFVAVENPIPMRAAELPRPNAFADPSWYGVKYTKKTCYWLRNLPPLMGSYYYPNAKSYVNASRGKYRSRTFKPMADAIAKQWSDYILDEMTNKATNSECSAADEDEAP